MLSPQSTPSSSGGQLTNHENTIDENTQSQQLGSRRSYTNAVKSHTPTVFPKRDQAIIMNATDEFKLVDYVVAIGNIVGTKNVLFASTRK